MLRRMLHLRRRPLETFAQYNIRTARTIEKWMSGSSLQFCYMRVLKAVFKSAWREVAFHLDNGETPLQDARGYRTALWWQTLAAIAPAAERKRLAIQHAHQGQQKTSWEHCFVAAWGIHWRDLRDNCKTATEWMRHFPVFCKNAKEEQAMRRNPCIDQGKR